MNILRLFFNLLRRDWWAGEWRVRQVLQWRPGD